MEKRIIELYRRKFDDIRHEEDGIEYWYARELMTLLDYVQWRNFENVVKKGMLSCKNNGIRVEDHFAGVSKMVTLGSGANREVEDYMLTRYACYLIAENGDPRKEQIAFAQSYFAVQTRKQELIEERISYIERTEARGKLRESEKRLSQNIYERGVDDAGFGRIRSKGDQALFGGFTTKQMKERLGVQDKRPLADFLPTLTIAAKNLAKNEYESDDERYKLLLTETDRDILISLVEKKPIAEGTRSRLIENYDFFAGKLADKEIQPAEVYESIGKLQIVNITLDRAVDDAQAE